MTVDLNEDCLLEIFQHLTPVEWIFISEVCVSWRTAVLRLWKRISVEVLISPKRTTDYCVWWGISTKKAKKLLSLVIPFVQNLSIEIFDFNRLYYIRLNKFYQFKVLGHDVKKNFYDALNFVKYNANELVEIRLKNFTVSQIKTMSILFSQNKIKKLSANDVTLNSICMNNFTHDIEELSCELNNHAILASFEGRFPTLQKLSILIHADKYTQDEIQHCLSQILPFVNTVRTLKLNLYTESLFLSLNLASGVYDDIFQLSELRELTLRCYISKPRVDFSGVRPYIDQGGLESMEDFLGTLSSCLIQLRVVDFQGSIRLSSRSISLLLRLPDLQTLNVKMDPDFCADNFPVAQNISKCNLTFGGWDDPIKNYGVNVVEMMKKLPKLKHLWITEFANPQSHDILCPVIDYVASQGKKLVITFRNNFRNNRYKELKVERKKSYEFAQSSGERTQIFNIAAYFPEYELETLLEPLNKFLNENRKDHYAFICDVNK